MWHGVSPRYTTELRLRLVVPLLLLALVGSLLGAMTLGGAGVAASLVVVAVVAAVAVRATARRAAAWGWAERHDDLLVRRGVLVRRLVVVPYGRLQLVDVTQGPLQRALGLSAVQLHTAAAASDAYLPGLPEADAALLRDHLARRGEAHAAGL